MTIVITDKALDGSYEDSAKKLRDHGVIVHAIGWGKVSYLCSSFFYLQSLRTLFE